MNNNPQVQGHFIPILYTGYPQGRGHSNRCSMMYITKIVLRHARKRG